MYESIFGKNAPQFIADYNLPGQKAPVLLNHWVPNDLDIEQKKITLESETEAERDIIYRGEYLTYSGKIYLWKYGNSAESKLNEIMQYRFAKNLTLWEHRDGQPFLGEDGNPVLFALDQVKRSYLTTLVYKDVLSLTFVSLKAVNLGTGTPIAPILGQIKIVGEQY